MATRPRRAAVRTAKGRLPAVLRFFAFRAARDRSRGAIKRMSADLRLLKVLQRARLKYCTARSCFCAAARVLKVPRLRRLPVFGFFLREYNRYSPELNLRIMRIPFVTAKKRCFDLKRWV